MKTLLSLMVALALSGCYATVGEEGRGSGGGATFSLSHPAVLPLVVVEPGVSVARDYDHEVFFVDGYYWARQDRNWYRTRDHRSGWGRVEERQVPGSIVRSPPGRYRHYRGDEHQGQSEHERHEGHDRERG
jgi:hypothetical protein